MVQLNETGNSRLKKFNIQLSIKASQKFFISIMLCNSVGDRLTVIIGCNSKKEGYGGGDFQRKRHRVSDHRRVLRSPRAEIQSRVELTIINNLNKETFLLYLFAGEMLKAAKLKEAALKFIAKKEICGI